MELNTVQDIERAIAGLTPEQRQELLVRVEEHYPQPLDLRLQEDLHLGRMDDRLDRALEDDRAGRTRLL